MTDIQKHLPTLIVVLVALVVYDKFLKGKF